MGKGVTPSPSPNPTASWEFCLDDVWGPIHTTWRVTIAPFGTICIHGQMSETLHAGPYACCASMRPPGACLCDTNCHIWRDIPRFLLSTNLLEEPECLFHRSPCQSSCWPGCCSQLGTTSVPPNGDPGSVQLWSLERMYPGGIEPLGSRRVAWSGTGTGQGAVAQMGTPVCLQWHGHGQTSLIKHQIKLMD